MNEGQIKQNYNDAKVYLVAGKLLNQLIKKMITQIEVDGVTVTKPRPNVAKINFDWLTKEDCDGNTFDIPTRPAEDEGD